MKTKYLAVHALRRTLFGGRMAENEHCKCHSGADTYYSTRRDLFRSCSRWQIYWYNIYSIYYIHYYTYSTHFILIISLYLYNVFFGVHFVNLSWVWAFSAQSHRMPPSKQWSRIWTFLGKSWCPAKTSGFLGKGGYQLRSGNSRSAAGPRLSNSARSLMTNQGSYPLHEFEVML